MKYILAPSILSADFKDLGEELNVISECGAEWVHIDVMDGLFVPSISFGMPVIKSIRPATDRFFDVHLMIEEPIRYIDDFKASGADLITIHHEACKDVAGTIRAIKASGLKAGVSIKPKTDVDVLDEIIGLCDLVLLMSVEPGFGGQSFIDGSLERAKAIRKKIDDMGLDTDLEIDGGIKTGNLQEVLDAGVNVIVAGSAIFNDTKNNTIAFMNVIDAMNKKTQ